VHNHSFSARLAIAFCGWLLARCGVEWHLGPAAGHSLRDKRGRFRPKDGGGYGLPRDIPHHVADLLFDMGVTPEMYDSAPVALVLPADVEDIGALERALREWVAGNLDHWINGERRSIFSVFNALKYTYAINYWFYKPPKKWIGRGVDRSEQGGARGVAPPRAGFKQVAAEDYGARASSSHPADAAVDLVEQATHYGQPEAEAVSAPDDRAEGPPRWYQSNIRRHPTTTASVALHNYGGPLRGPPVVGSQPHPAL
jgi:hypothetical protein